jgi:protein O-GlcNAc transferase
MTNCLFSLECISVMLNLFQHLILRFNCHVRLVSASLLMSVMSGAPVIIKKSMNIAETIRQALRQYQSGNLREASLLFEKALETRPDNAEVLYLLGIIHGQLGNYDPAITYIRKSIQLNPANDEACLALGITLRQKGPTDEAIDYFERALHLNPDNTDARRMLAECLQDKGNVFQGQELFDQAAAYYKKAIDTDPKRPNADILYQNLGFSFQARELADEAISCYHKALEVNPGLLAAYNNLGIVLQKKGRFDEAVACYEKALMIDPRSAETHYNLGALRQRQGKHEEASAAYDEALQIKPDYVAARWAKCMAQLPAIYTDHSQIEMSRQRYTEELIKLSGSIPLDTGDDIRAAVGAVGTQQPFDLAYQGLNDKDLQRTYGNLVCKIMSACYPQLAVRPVIPPPAAKEPLRIGVVSGHFNSHPVWEIITKGWVENLDRNKISLYGYYTRTRKDSETLRARRSFLRFVEDVYSFEGMCRAIVNDRLHAIIYPEIGMDPVTVKLAALRLAPVQCISWGHPDTSGVPTIDYFLSGDLFEPPDGDAAYTEKLVRLPNISVYYDPGSFRDELLSDDRPLSRADRKAFGLRPKSVLYHCCQTLFKFLPLYDEVFPRIARQVGDCQFLFSSLPGIPLVVEQFRMRIHRAFARYDLNAGDYIVFIPHLDRVTYNALNRLSDVFLDPIGWSGCTSTLEAIDCDLPVVAFPGAFMRGRESSAILTMMGVKETIAGSLDEYIELASNLGKDKQRRRRISAEIAENKHKIYRDRTCITALEGFLLKAVEEELS